MKEAGVKTILPVRKYRNIIALKNSVITTKSVFDTKNITHLHYDNPIEKLGLLNVLHDLLESTLH